MTTEIVEAARNDGRSRMQIRAERPGDEPALRTVHEAAFDTAAEADLVDALRVQATPVVSLVADDGGTIVGHIVFSPVTLSGDGALRIMGLGPMAVLPARQRQGVGTLLVTTGLDACATLGAGAVVVLGHPTYYPRFGFRPATELGIGCEYDVPADVFMVRELQPGCLAGVTGTARYHPAFARL